MILYEFEGKKLLFNSGINVPVSQLLNQPTDETVISAPLILKAQVLSGKRAAAGGIVVLEQKEHLAVELADLFGQKINQEKVEKILIEEKILFDRSYYLSLSYDTDTRGPVLTISSEGGTGIESRGGKSYQIEMLDQFGIIPQLQKDFALPVDLLEKIIRLFFEGDCLLLEINPLVKTENNRWIALDAKIKLEDNALARHPEWDFPPRSAPGHTSTKNEIEAKKIDEGDYRGVAGSAYFDLPGDIAVLASGGGASLTALDALIRAGGKPANYTEYGGNPPKEKVEKLTKVVLDKPNLNGLWVVGALANFTNIYQTMLGFIEALTQVQAELDKRLDFPIVIRRAGPNDQEAKKMLSEVRDFDLHIFGEEISITQSARIMVDLAKEYAHRKEKRDT